MGGYVGVPVDGYLGEGVCIRMGVRRCSEMGYLMGVAARGPGVGNLVDGFLLIVGVLVVLYALGVGYVRPRIRGSVHYYELVPMGKNIVNTDAVKTVLMSIHSGVGRYRTLWLVRYWDGTSMRVYLGAEGGLHDQLIGQIAGALQMQYREVVGGIHLGGLTRVSKLISTRWMDTVYNPASTPRGNFGQGVGQLLMHQGGPSVLTICLQPLNSGQAAIHRRLLQRRGRDNPQWYGTNGHHHLQTSALFRMSMWAATSDVGDPGGIVTATATQDNMPGFSYRVFQMRIRDYGMGVAMAALVGVGAAGIATGVVGSAGVFGMVAGLAVPTALWALRRGSLLRRRRLLQIERGQPPIHRDLVWVNVPDRSWDVNDDEGSRRPRRSPRNHATRWLVVSPLEMSLLFVPPSEYDPSMGGVRGAQRAAPAPVLSGPGVPVGVDSRGTPVFVSDGARRDGIMAYGDPNQGKTVFMLGLWGYDLAYREQRRIMNGGVPDSCHIWLEEKGEGADRAYQRAKLAGIPDSEILRLDIVSTSGPRLDLVDRADNVRSAKEITEAMIYAFPPGAIMGRAKDVLERNWELVLAIPPDMSSKFKGGVLPSDLNLLLLILGGIDAEKQTKFLNMLASRAGGGPGGQDAGSSDLISLGVSSGPLSDEERLANALERYRYYVDSVPARDRAEIMRPTIGRISDLLPTAAMWQSDPTRQAVSFADMLRDRRVVIINFGGGQITPVATAQIASMATYMLRATIERVCEGWEASGQAVYIYCDELANIIGSRAGDATDIDVISNLKDIGRSRGVKLNFATQRANQLPDSDRRVLSTISTKLYLRTESVDMAAEAIMDLVGREVAGHNSNVAFTPEDVRNLPQLEGIMRTRVEDIAQPPFNLRLVPEDQIDFSLIAANTPGMFNRPISVPEVGGGAPIDVDKITKMTIPSWNDD